MADVQVGNLLKLEIDGVSEALMFHKFDPPTLTLENITHNTWDDTGNLLSHSGGGKNPLSGEWGIERAVDDQGVLFAWFKDTHDKGRSDPGHQEGLQDLPPQPRWVDPQDVVVPEDLDPELLVLGRRRELATRS